ncbi:hypothetical protein UAJ10_03175 [Nitrospirillum sp. BR 11164]|uniref:hypothetical protein n=1 Tax=Nitrospirillum sp. BR 11164 TaxID=3104324 RepID=UPI002B003E0E|nr:hypothetical protein [Nitrospirillum sp. BR 11164]MEA1648021.1 hypothetical protein [Nitrospirillum sp. BR 11164]
MPEPSRQPTAPTGLAEEIIKDGAFERVIRFHPTGIPVPADRPRALLIAPLSGVNPRLLYDMVADLTPSTDLHLLEWRDAADMPLECGGFSLARRRQR